MVAKVNLKLNVYFCYNVLLVNHDLQLPIQPLNDTKIQKRSQAARSYPYLQTLTS